MRVIGLQRVFFDISKRVEKPIKREKTELDYD